jgi:hypothetical protein
MRRTRTRANARPINGKQGRDDVRAMTNKEGTLETLGPFSNRDALLGLKPATVWATLFKRSASSESIADPLSARSGHPLGELG